MAWPRHAHAQQATFPVVGFMSSRSSGDSVHLLAAFRKGLSEGGFAEGRTATVEYRWADGDYARLPELATDLVQRRVSVIVSAGGDASTQAAMRATSSIPIVFGSGSDPIATGYVASINRPGGHVAGVSIVTNQMEPKRLGLLTEMAPGATRIGVLLNDRFEPAARQLSDLERAAATLNKRLLVVKASNEQELAGAFTALTAQKPDALLVTAAPFFDTRREQIVSFAARERLPAMYQFREFALEGGLASYGIDLVEAYRMFGSFAARVLKGEKPAEMPVQQVEKFELVINLKAAKALGFEFPPTFSARANEVIE
ncbi:MAG: ABC transporter substrate-binding protein [Hyphomicrobiales bacterium]